jgi:hypothetical protein
MPAVAIRRFASPCLLAGFVRPGIFAWREQAVGGRGLFSSNNWDATRLAGLLGEIPSASARGVARRAARLTNATVRAAAPGLVADAATYRAIWARLVPGPRSGLLRAQGPHRQPGQHAGPAAAMRHASRMIGDADKPAADSRPGAQAQGGGRPGSFSAIADVRAGAVV